MPRLFHHREPCALEEELVRAEIALWRRQPLLPVGRRHVMGRAERLAIELRLVEVRAPRRLGATWEGPHDT
jgi:hypothetical protein